jgi:hypothetical protein
VIEPVGERLETGLPFGELPCLRVEDLHLAGDVLDLLPHFCDVMFLRGQETHAGLGTLGDVRSRPGGDRDVELRLRATTSRARRARFRPGRVLHA